MAILLDQLGLGKATETINRARREGWTSTIEKSLHPDSIVEAYSKGNLQELLEKTYQETLQIQSRPYFVRECILDWIFVTGVYLSMTEGKDTQRQEAYGKALDFAKKLWNGDRKY